MVKPCENDSFLLARRARKGSLGILKNQLVSGIPENYHESVRSFWDPISELKSEYSAETLHVEVEKVKFLRRAPRAEKDSWDPFFHQLGPSTRKNCWAGKLHAETPCTIWRPYGAHI